MDKINDRINRINRMDGFFKMILNGICFINPLILYKENFKLSLLLKGAFGEYRFIKGYYNRRKGEIYYIEAKATFILKQTFLLNNYYIKRRYKKYKSNYIIGEERLRFKDNYFSIKYLNLIIIIRSKMLFKKGFLKIYIIINFSFNKELKEIIIRVISKILRSVPFRLDYFTRFLITSVVKLLNINNKGIITFIVSNYRFKEKVLRLKDFTAFIKIFTDVKILHTLQCRYLSRKSKDYKETLRSKSEEYAGNFLSLNALLKFRIRIRIRRSKKSYPI
ncbi:hypothetical protein B0T21DRAFT_352385 [Apiosordaria backusii]|uniref:Uncharacterized protein n=1 Tax=Apiosordaria backusii TaxID=314023 RepID=A0AA40AA70_9PEZI|nr:hypothetical protein B0T21DRAFT_352385 [Apiosordaria backusii]